MNKEQQDKLWNDLRQLTQELLIEKYTFLSTQSSPVLKAIKYALENTYGSHNLNPKPLTYEDVAKELFGGRVSFHTEVECKSHKQLSKILAINKFLNVAKYLNGDWKPDWENITPDEKVWSFGIDENEIRAYYVQKYDGVRPEIVYFRTKELAQQAIQILGEETIKLALTTDY